MDHAKARIGTANPISRRSNARIPITAPGGGSFLIIECHIAIKMPPKSMLETTREPRLSAGRTITMMPADNNWK